MVIALRFAVFHIEIKNINSSFHDDFNESLVSPFLKNILRAFLKNNSSFDCPRILNIYGQWLFRALRKHDNLLIKMHNKGMESWNLLTLDEAITFSLPLLPAIITFEHIVALGSILSNFYPSEARIHNTVGAGLILESWVLSNTKLLISLALHNDFSFNFTFLFTSNSLFYSLTGK